MIDGSGGAVLQLFAGVLVAVGGFAIVAGLLTGIRAIRLWWNDPVATTEVPQRDGEVEVEGTAKPLYETVKAPYSGTDCLLCKSKRGRKEGDSAWEWDEEQEKSVPFLVEDAYGQVVVDPSSGILVVDSKYDTEGTEGNTKTMEIERRIDPGETVHVRGRVQQSRSRGDIGGRQVFLGGGLRHLQISEGTERESIMRELKGAVLFLAVGLLFIEGLAGYLVLERSIILGWLY